MVLAEVIAAAGAVDEETGTVDGRGSARSDPAGQGGDGGRAVTARRTPGRDRRSPTTARNDPSGCHLGSSRRWAVAPLRPGGDGPPQIAAPARPPGDATSRRRPAPAGEDDQGTRPAPAPPGARSGTRTRRLTDRFSAGQPRRRLIGTLVVMLLILSAVLVKVGLLQTVEGDSLRRDAAQQWTRDRPLRAERGTIFDRNGEELALSVPASTITVNPKLVTDPEGLATTFGQCSASRRAARRAGDDDGRKRQRFRVRRPPGRQRVAEQIARPRARRRRRVPRGPPDAARVATPRAA